VVADGSGNGHGVGLCQWGAVGRARAGQDYQQILAAYYGAADLSRWY
jgi:stage II sporulation protein D